MSSVPTRLGIMRPTAVPDVIAEAEARVIEHELGRRLGDIVCDFRIDGAPVGRWASCSTAPWPRDVDAVIDPALLWNDAVAPLTTLFGRTVDATGADVRVRMLEHLGVRGEPVDDGMVADGVPWRPTDLWLLCLRDGVAPGASPVLTAFADDSGAHQLDAAFDAAAAHVDDQLDGRTKSIAVERLQARIDDLGAELALVRDEAQRERVELLAALDEARAERSVLAEQLERVRLDGGTT